MRSILALLQQINREFGLTIVLITHEMQVIKQLAQQVAVIDHGRIVEQGAVLDVFTRPQHETTRSLLDDIAPQELPESVLARIRALMQDGSAQTPQLLRLAFAPDNQWVAYRTNHLDLLSSDAVFERLATWLAA